MSVMTTETVLVTAILFALVAINLALLMLQGGALMRFVFGIISLSIFGLGLAYGDVPFSPYLQLMGLLVSALGMLAAARVRD